MDDQSLDMSYEDAVDAFAPGSAAYVAKLARMEQAVRVLIQGVGEQVHREGLLDTPLRVAKAFLDMTEGYRQACSSVLNSALFHEPELAQPPANPSQASTAAHTAGQLVLVRDIDFASTSEETLLPFHGRVHVAYVPMHGVVLGLSKLARLTRLCAKRVQSQERLTREVLGTMQAALGPVGVAVVIEARHLTFNAQAQPPKSVTIAVAGSFDSSSGSDSVSDTTSGKACSAHSPLLEEVLTMLDLETADSKVQPVETDPQLVHCSATRIAAPGFGLDRRSRYCGSVYSIDRSNSADSAAALAPPTPDPSEGGGVDVGDSGDTSGDSEVAEEQLSCSWASEQQETDSMEAAMAVLLAEAGVETAALQPSIRRYVMSLLASTSGYHQELPMRAVKQQQLPAQQPPCSHEQPQQQQQPQQQPQLHQHSNQHQLEVSHSATAPPAACTGSSSGAWCWHEHSLSFTSQCEHHMLPFYGTAHIAYVLPAGQGGCQPLSSSEAEQVVATFSQRLQIQERITHQVADAVNRLTGAVGVMVVCRAAHMCMVARGVENHAGSTVTRAAMGAFADSPQLRARALAAARKQGGVRAAGSVRATGSCSCCGKQPVAFSR